MTHRNALTLASLSSLLLAVGACEMTEKSPTEERAEARQEISEAAKGAQQEMKEAGKEYGEKIAETQKDLAKDVREGAEKMGEAGERTAGELGLKEGQYERFEALQDESAATFASRADTAIARVEADLEQARKQAGTTMTEDVKESFTEAEEAIKEAKTDLQQIRTQKGTTIDDGRLGVATNINEAQRTMSEIHKSMSKAKM